MKVYISADIEGVTGVTTWDEAELHKPDHGIAQEQMTAEVRAACEGALNAGATEIWVKDAHDSGRNSDCFQITSSGEINSRVEWTSIHDAPRIG